MTGAVRVSLFPQVRAEPARGKRGRGATPRVERRHTFAQPNPADRRTIVYRYRRLQAWTDEQVAIAEQLLEYFFRRLGGFLIVSDRLMRLYIDALENYTPREICLAIDAKAKSMRGANADETREKRKFAATPDGFIERGIEYWLSQSVEWREEQARAENSRQRERERERHDRLSQIAVQSHRKRPSYAARLKRAQDRARKRWDHCRDAAIKKHRYQQRRRVDQLADAFAQQRAAERRQGAADGRKTRRLAWWNALSPRQREMARGAVMPQFKTQCANYGWDVNDGRGDPLLQAMSIDFALKRFGGPTDL